MPKVAVVSGGNKGLGLAIVEALVNQLKDGWAVYLTARNEQLGLESVKKLADKGVKAHFHQLDVTSEQSIDKLAEYLKTNYGGLDILINNAGIAYTMNSTVPQSEQADVTLTTNFFAQINVCDKLFPLLRPHARVMNMSSFLALKALDGLSADMRKTMTSELTKDELISLMKEYISDVKAGDNYRNKGWCGTSYGTSKMAFTALTILQQREFEKDAREDIIVNAGDPGYVSTDMSQHLGPLSVHEGADTPVYLALLPPNTKSPRGNHVSERKIVQWK